jgi:photosynthetic reaction center H subunit
MSTGAITSYIDVAQLTLYAFWFFFAGLIFYLRREDRREGYPLESDLSGQPKRRLGGEIFPLIPAPKTFHLHDGRTVQAPRLAEDRTEIERRGIKAERLAPWPGAPLVTGADAMTSGVGPGAWAERDDAPEMTFDGDPSIVPLRVATDHWVASEDLDPRGMEVVGADDEVAGTVADLWIDLAEPQIRYLEVALAAPPGRDEDDGETAAVVSNAGNGVLVPMTLARIAGNRVKVKTVLARHFADVPILASPDRVTKREEDRISAYFAGGQLYADPKRMEPIL